MDPMDEKKLRALQMLQPPGLGKGRALLATLRTLMLFTAAMITLPIGLYFVSKTYLFEGVLGLPAIDSYFYSAIVAVVSVHIVLALFVYMAWNEGTRQWQETSKLE
ncbi:vacuolar ATPase assembly integral membrane protein Vma21-like [Monodelphis domestica]|uniref:vacuolar ATPase assembly integral membrane protein Vma21-like n=1 Tax=Monodelphis domestica TaxID=13616 RepID=UPI0024E19DC0|nr:vacuolar ATPase assembly integral membrane protein Vma21-like [Monodelphis domestica]